MGTKLMIRWCGIATAVGGLIWGVLFLLVEPGSRIELAGGLAWQLGAAAMLWTMHVTRATGTSRWGQGILAVTATVLALATVWSVAAVVAPTAQSPILTALDSAWPLSQVLLLANGITVAAVRVWPGATRWLPLLGGLWFPVAMASQAAGEMIGTLVPGVWITATYAAIGLAIAGPVATGSRRGIRPAETGAVAR